MGACGRRSRIAGSCWLRRNRILTSSAESDPVRMGRVTANDSGSRGFGGLSSGVWCDDAGAGMAARLARLGFDWVCLDMQHGRYSRTEVLEAARGFPVELAELVVRVPSCDFTAIGAALAARG